MPGLPNQDTIIRRLVRWAEDRDAVRAMILTSTRADPDAPVDRFSDYDVILAVADPVGFYDDRSWLDDFGTVLVVYRDPMETVEGGVRFAYITQYEDGLKLDFTLWSVGILKELARQTDLPDELDVGYSVLLDKDELAVGLAVASQAAFVPDPPSQAAFGGVVEEFFHEATYVAKHLWRDDLLPMKYNLDHAMKQRNLRRMLEWRMELDHGWALSTRAYGKGLKRRLPAGTWRELELTYVGAGIEENWDALFRTIDLFREVALEVAGGLGLDYPHELDSRVTRYLAGVRNLKREDD